MAMVLYSGWRGVIHTSGTTHRGTRYGDYNDLPGHTPGRRGTAANRWRRRALAYIGW